MIVSQDLPVHGQLSAAIPDVFHHVNDTLVDNDSDTASVSRASERDNRDTFTAAGPARIAWDVVQFDLTVDDGAERVPVVEAGSATPVAQDDDTDHEMGVSEAGSEGVFEFIAEPEVNVVVPRAAGLREALLSLDRWHLPDLVKKRACVMKSVPRFLKGPFRNALRVALEEATADQLCRQERGWKLFILLPRMLLHRPPRGGLLSKEKLIQRFNAFSQGQWENLLEASARCDEQTAVSRRRSRRRDGDDVERRAARAEMLVGLGELSSASPITCHQPRSRALDERRFYKNMRSAKRGAAGGPSGMTMEHLRPLLDSPKDLKLFFKMAESLARAEVPDAVTQTIRMGRMTALRKPSGGVRGIVAGDIIRTLVARTMAQQLGPQVEAATSPFQYALSTRAGSECVAHVLQGLCELDDPCTVTSIDRISAYDLVSRAAMLDGLLNRVGGEALPFVRMFYGSPSSYMWEDADGVEHTIRQGEGGEQGDALMPLLFCLGQHSALEAVQDEMREGEFLFAYLDDIYIVTRPERVGAVYASLREHLQSFARIRIHGGKTQVWNRGGVRPPVCDVLERIAQAENPDARVWRGSQDSDLVPGQQGITVLGTPLGTAAFVESQLEMKVAQQRTLLERIPAVPDLQSAWLLLLHCASARANYLLLVVEPQAVAEYARSHDDGIWQCLCTILHISPDMSPDTRSAANLPLVLGGVGLRSACRVSVAAYWASWADCLPMMYARHPHVAERFIVQLEGSETPFLGAAAASARALSGTMGFEPPSWRALADGVRPDSREPEDYEPGVSRQGWQHEAASRVERQFRDGVLFERLVPRDRALIRSQAGPGAGLVLTKPPRTLSRRSRLTCSG